MMTPSASEKKSVMNSLLSDDETSTFEPAKSVTMSARKRMGRPTMAALSTTA